MAKAWFIVSPRPIHSMVKRQALTESIYNIAVVGAGAVGLSAALAFARDGFRTVLVGGLDARRDGRTVALLNGSVRFLAANTPIYIIAAMKTRGVGEVIPNF